MNIRLFKPSVGKEELRKIETAFKSSWIGLGPRVHEFELAWSKYIGCKTSIGVNSCTAALHLALKCLNFEKGKKVLVPSQTFSATASAVLYNDLIPVFVDSDPITLGISISDLEKKYDTDCVAVIPVHFAGHPIKIDVLVEWAKEKELRVIEDCAHTAGSKYKGKILGTWGDIGCYSFEEKKLMTTGDGGMICTNNEDLFRDIKAMRWVGIDKDNWKSAQEYLEVNKDAMHWFYEISVLGYKYNMNDLAASIGLAQLKKLNDMNKRRDEIISQYIKGIKKLEKLSLLLPFDPGKYSYQMFGIRFDQRDELMIYLKSKGIATGCHYTPLTLQPLFRKYEGECPIIESIYPTMMTLPLHSDLTNEEVDYILESLESFF